MTDDVIYYCWFKWKIEVIKADHDGYCTDSINEEEISYFKKYYLLNDNEY